MFVLLNFLLSFSYFIVFILYVYISFCLHFKVSLVIVLFLVYWFTYLSVYISFCLSAFSLMLPDTSLLNITLNFCNFGHPLFVELLIRVEFEESIPDTNRKYIASWKSGSTPAIASRLRCRGVNLKCGEATRSN